MSDAVKSLAMFPGQGSQYVGMAKMLLDEAYPGLVAFTNVFFYPQISAKGKWPIAAPQACTSN